jgi:hypothetical protein
MDQTLRGLYTRYVGAAEFFNAQVERKYSEESVRALFRMNVLSEREFPQWWADVSKDHELRARWLERFEDPESSFQRNCERIRKELDQIPIRRVAA